MKRPKNQETVMPLQLFVAFDGNDGWSGRLASANAEHNDGPLASLTGARDVIRRLRYSQGLQQPIEVLVRGGTYRLTEPFRLWGGDSGTATCPITYRAYPGEQPVLSGGRRISDWKPYKGQIVCAELPEVRANRWWFRQLFYNNQRMIRARWPKFDHKDPLYGGWAFIQAVLPESDGAGPMAFTFRQERLPGRWSKPHQAEVFVFPGKCWINDIIPVRKVDFEKGVIHLTRPVGPSANTLGTSTHLTAGNRFYVENNLEDLTEPGEWCLDRDSGILYFWPPDPSGAERPDEKLNAAGVVAPATTRLIQMIGSPAMPLEHVRVQGFTFRHTQVCWPTAESYYKTPNAGQTVYLENTRDCAIEDNLFDAVGGDAIRLQGINTRNRITGNTIAEVGGYGIFVGSLQRGFTRYDTCSGDVPSTREWTEHPEDRAATVAAWPRSSQHLIAYNHIHHVGRYEKHGLGIGFYGVSAVDVVVAHNVIHDTPRFGIGLMSGFGRVTIEYNDLYNLSQETSDTGGITFNRWYTYENDPDLARGCIIRFNRVRDVIGCGAYKGVSERIGSSKAGGRIWTPYYGWAIYFDNAPMDVLVHGNICARSTLGGLAISHYGKNVTVENNIFVDGGQSQVYLMFAGEMSNIRLRRNIFSYSCPEADFLRLNYEVGMVLKQVLTQFDYNVLHPPTGTDLSLNGRPAEAVQRAQMNVLHPTPAIWQKLGFDAHSIVADPKFVDPAQDNYDLKPDSPALALGFVPIDASQIGNTPAINYRNR